MEFVQRGGRGQTPNPKIFGIHFCSIKIQIWRRYRAIDTYFWIQTLGRRGGSTKNLDEIHTFIFYFFYELPYVKMVLPWCQADASPM